MAYPSIKQGWGILGLLILVTICYAMPLGIIGMFYPDIQQGPFHLLNYSIPIVILIFITRSWWKKNPKNDSTIQFKGFPLAILPVVLIMTISLVVIHSEIASWVPMPDWLVDVFKEFLQPNIWGFITIVIAAPILEEILMRGIVLNGLLRNYSPWKAIIWSSVFFGVIHLNPWQFVTAMIAGMVIGYLYWKTKSLWLCILIHAVNNGIAFYLTVKYSEVTNFSELFNIGKGERIGLFIGAGLCLWGSYLFYEKYFNSQSETNRFNKTEK